jgi:hypothetical protein
VKLPTNRPSDAIYCLHIGAQAFLSFGATFETWLSFIIGNLGLATRYPAALQRLEDVET